MCLLLAGCSAPTTVLVRFSTVHGSVLDDLQVLIAAGSTPLDAAAPHALPVGGGLASGSLLVPLDTARSEPVTVLFEGHTGGRAVSATATTTSKPHAQVTLDVAIDDGVAPSDGGTLDGGDAAVPCGIFCDDFDDRTAVQGAWDHLIAIGAASTDDATISSTESVSPPHAVAFHSMAHAQANGDGVTLSVSVPLKGDTLTVDLDLEVVGFSTGNAGYSEVMSLGADGKYLGGFTLESATQVAADRFFRAADGGVTHPLGYAPLLAGWRHLRYAITFSQSDGAVDVVYDGAEVLKAIGVPTLSTGALPSSVSLFIGSSSVGAVGAYDVYFDNVRVE